jgi:hypothetical protein
MTMEDAGFLGDHPTELTPGVFLRAVYRLDAVRPESQVLGIDVRNLEVQDAPRPVA